jgi:FKBP-type peptidyl-prolyl cis-trans isomerase FkpA
MLRRALAVALIALTSVACNAAESEAETAAAAAPQTDDDKILYSIGLAMSRQLQQFDFSEQELAMVEKGLADGALERDKAVDLQTWGPKIDQFLQARMAAAGEKQKAEGQAFLDKQKAEAGAQVLDSGMVMFTLTEGTGAQPGATDTVKVNYRGSFPSGEEFDSSAPGNPVSFGLNAVVPCFSQGIQKMKVGGKARLVCPSEMAYGQRGSPPRIPPNATLVFEVELVEIAAAATPPPAAEPPASDPVP